MRLMIVEDHGLLAQSLAAALRAEGHDVVMVTAPTLDGVVAHARDFEPELVLLDLDLGGAGTGLAFIRPLRSAGAQVVMLTGVTDRVRLAECVEAGATGVIDKSRSFDELLDAMRQIVRGGALMTRHEHEELLSVLRRRRESDRRRLQPFRTLTPREREVLQQLQEGRNAEAIAAEWVVSVTTVRSQIRSLLHKLGVNSQLSAVAAARQAGWDGD